MRRPEARSAHKVANGRRIVALACVLTLLTGCAAQGESFLTPGGPVAQSELAHFFKIAGLSLVAIIPVLILTPLLVWRYRRGGKGQYAPDWDYSRSLEAAMWGVPAVIVVVLATQLVRNTLALDPYRPIAGGVAPLRVDVVALNWKWLFILPDFGIATVDELDIPVGTPVVFRLTSDSSMQSFRVSALAGQVYVMPGMETRQTLVANRVGDFKGQNTQYNGTGFAGQSFVVKAVPRVEFDRWVAQVRSGGCPLDAGRYQILAAPSTTATAARQLQVADNTTIRFSSLTPQLFDTVVHRYMLPRAIVPSEQPGAPAFVAQSVSARLHKMTPPSPSMNP